MRVVWMSALALGVVACEEIEDIPVEELDELEELDEETLQRLSLGGETCGEAVCSFGEYCCNESCSACVPFGASCTQEVCDPTF